MLLNAKDVPSTDSEVKLSSYGTSPPIPQTNRTYLGPHDITKKKDFLRHLNFCVCVLFCMICMFAWNVSLHEMCVSTICMLCMLVRSVCIYVCVYVCVLVCMNLCMFVCMFCMHECMYVFNLCVSGSINDCRCISWFTNYYSYWKIGCFIYYRTICEKVILFLFGRKKKYIVTGCQKHLR